MEEDLLAAETEDVVVAAGSVALRVEGGEKEVTEGSRIGSR